MKVYAVEVGEYSDRYIDAIFTTRELADQWITNRIQRDWANEQRSINSTDSVVKAFMRSPYEGWTFEQFAERDHGNAYGTVEEYEVWDALPVVRP